jgi:hypothetical protein
VKILQTKVDFFSIIKKSKFIGIPTGKPNNLTPCPPLLEERGNRGQGV